MARHRILSLLAIFWLLATLGAAQPTTPATTQTDPPKAVFDKAVKDDVLAAVAKIVEERAFVPGVDLKKWPDLLAKQQAAIDRSESEAEFARIVNRALRDLGVSHVRLLAPRASQARNRVSVIGPGFNARQVDGGLTVTSVFPKSAAEAAGIAAGDKITMVDGKAPDSPDVLTGEPGTDVKLKFRHADQAEKELTLRRERFSTIRKETLTWKGDDTAILKIFTFGKAYGSENVETLMTQAAKAKYLILDLRSNGGGSTGNLQHLLSLLMPAQTNIGAFVSRDTVKHFVEAKQGDGSDTLAVAKWNPNKYRTFKGKVDAFTGKIAVLVNRGSASASEICSWALRENLGSPIIGSKSAGAVLASFFRKIDHGFELQYPVSDYVTYKGVRLEGNPITPDAEVTTKADGDGDPAVDKAIELLKAKALLFWLFAA